jgi:outer membrane lipopolysaccharide assembly protein LptE/RlpB
MKAVLLLLGIVVGGCGYHLAGKQLTVPQGARTISIRQFTNRTKSYGLEVALQRAVEDEFRRRGTLHLVRDRSAADLVLSGTIRSVSTTPSALSGNAEALQYRGIIRVSVALVDRASGQVLYENKALQESQDFGAISGVVVTGSPSFQRGLLDAQDLAGLTNVQLQDSRRNAALDELIDLMAREIYINAMEGF